MILIDSNVWIFAAREGQPEHSVAIERVGQVLGSGGACVNDLIVSEVFHIISLLHGKPEAQRKVAAILGDALVDWLPFTRAQAMHAITLSMKSGIRINDAMLAAQAVQVGARILTDNVKDFSRVPGLKIVPLRESR